MLAWNEGTVLLGCFCSSCFWLFEYIVSALVGCFLATSVRFLRRILVNGHLFIENLLSIVLNVVVITVACKIETAKCTDSD